MEIRPQQSGERGYTVFPKYLSALILQVFLKLPVLSCLDDLSSREFFEDVPSFFGDKKLGNFVAKATATSNIKNDEKSSKSNSKK